MSTLVDRLRDHRDLLGYDEPLLKEAAGEVARLTADVERWAGMYQHLADATEHLRADLAAARAERDGLRARLRQTQRILWDDESDDLGCATAWEQALLRTRAALATLPTPPNGGTE